MKKLILLSLYLSFYFGVQSQDIRTVATKAGQLSTDATSYLATVTTLTITGAIDARDFKTMRDNMPLLTIVDMSEVTIAPYTGTEGTGNPGTEIIYPENEIPQYAFGDPISYSENKTLFSIKMPASTTSIGDFAFFQCIGLTGTLEIPSLVTNIGDHAFFNCAGLSGVLTLPASVTSIKQNAFHGCTGLTGTLRFPDAMSSINDYVFSACTGFTSVIFPTTITSIGVGAFSDCSELKTMYLNEATPSNITLGWFSFTGVNKVGCKLYVPLGSKELYKGADQWSEFYKISEVKELTTFTATTNLYTQINLVATANANNDNIVVIYNNTGIFNSPVNDISTLKEGDAFANGTILYIGSPTGLINHTGLAKGTSYYYNAFVYDGLNNYSFGTIVSASTSTFDNPTTFTAISTSNTQINLSSTANTNGNQIVVVYNNTGVFMTPKDGIAFGNLGETFSGGTIVFNGAASSLTNHTLLIKGTEYYYKAFSYNSSYLYSNGLLIHARTTVDEPTNQPTNFSYGIVTTSSIPLNWTSAAAGLQLPDGYLIKLSLGKTVVDPVDGINPADILTITNGTANKKVESGTAYSATSFKGLQAGTMYNYKIYSYSNDRLQINYKLNAAPTIHHATLPASVIGQSYTVSETTNANISWTLPASYIPGNQSILVFLKATNNINIGTPTRAPSTYAANTTYGSGTTFQLDASAYCVYKGDGTNVTVTGLTQGTSYFVSIYTVVNGANSDGTNSYSNAASMANGVPGITNITTLVPNGVIQKVVSNDNYTYIGGQFSSVGQSSGYGAKLNTTSTAVDMSFAKANGIIHCCVPDGKGGWYIGGEFTRVGTLTRNHLAQLNFAGEVTAWNPNSEDLQDDRVQCILFNGLDIYVGGNFTSIGGVERNGIAKLNTEGAVDIDWNPNVKGSYGASISTITIIGNDVLVGGYFTNIGGQDRNNIAKLNNTNGNADSDWKPESDGRVDCIAVNNGEIYVGGFFYNIGGQERKYIAKLNNTNGNADSDWKPETTNQIKSIAFSNDDIFMGGDNVGWTITVNDVTTSNDGIGRIKKFNKITGAIDATWTFEEIGGPVNSIQIIGSDVYVGGRFETVGAHSINNAVKLNSVTGLVDTSWNPDFGGEVKGIAINGNDLYIGGDFLTFNGKARSGLARFNNSDGSLDLNWMPYANRAVSSIVLTANNVFVGGDFDEIGGILRTGIAKLNITDGAVDETWNALADRSVNAIVLSGNSLIVGGNFNSIGGQLQSHLAKLNTINGDADENWGGNANDDVNCLAINDNDLYAGGYFDEIGGVSRNYIAKLNASSGIVDPIWNPNATAPVYAVAVSANNIFAGGFFDNIGGLQRNILAKLNNTTGEADNVWNPDAAGRPMGGVKRKSAPSITTTNDLKSKVDAYLAMTEKKSGNKNQGSKIQKTTASRASEGGWLMNILPHGSDLYVGGIFNSMGGYTRNNIAKLNISDAKVDPDWNPNPDGAAITTIAIESEELYIGGVFTTIDGQFQPNLAKLKLSAPTVEYYNILSSETANLSAAANSTATVDVSSNTAWTASIDPSVTWLSVSPDILSSGNATLTFTAQANSGALRTALVTVTSNKGIANQTITVTQDDASTRSLTTQAVTNIEADKAIGNGNISVLGSPSQTAHGFCWNTSGTPTIANNKEDKGAASATGAFTASITGLTAGTTYHVRTFATNTDGETTYGNEVNFTYLSAASTISTTTSTTESDIVVSTDKTLTVDVTSKSINSITVNAGATLDMTKLLTVKDVTLKSDKDNKSFVANVGAGITASGAVRYIKTMTRDQWYFISFPCEVLKTDITLPNGSSLGTFGPNQNAGSDWEVKYYDGTSRAANGLTAGSNWKTITGDKLEAYKGYIFWLKAGAGTVDVTFKLDKTLVESETVRGVPVLANQVGNTLKNNKGWNLVGQPYLSRYAGGKAGVNYMTFPDGVEAQTYTTLHSSTNAGDGKIIDPFTAYFVQVDNANDITFAIDGRHAAPASVSNDASKMLQLNFTTATGTDNTNLIIDNDQTTAYVIGQDMVKWLGTGTAKPQVYTRLDNLDFSYNALPVASIVNLPLGVYTRTAGTATISADASSARTLSKLLLWDNTAKVETNLLATNYTFAADAGINNTRFLLSAQRIATETEMSEEVGAPTVTTMKTKLLVSYLSGENNILVYDAIGRVVVSKHTVDSSVEIPISIRGMYTVKIETATKSWKLKTVL